MNAEHKKESGKESDRAGEARVLEHENAAVEGLKILRERAAKDLDHQNTSITTMLQEVAEYEKQRDYILRSIEDIDEALNRLE